MSDDELRPESSALSALSEESSARIVAFSNADPVHRLPAYDEAKSAADQAAANAGLVVCELATPEQYRDAQQLLQRVWSADTPLVSVELMRVLTHCGGYVAGCYLGSTLVGATVGLLAMPQDDESSDLHLHSHITGVETSAQNRRAGFALKLHQRAWALGNGIDTIRWTFDPLVRRNAFFNLTKLGAVVDDYFMDFYGEMTDAINAGQGSDRVVVRWALSAERTVAAAAGRSSEPDVAGLPESTVVLSSGSDGWPVPVIGADSPTLLCATPAEIETIRKSDPELALQWREFLSDALIGAFADDYEVTGFTRSGWYVLTSPESGGPR